MRTVSAHILTMFKNETAVDKAEQTRRRIFEAALTLFREKGFDATTMQEIAQHAGVAKGAAYYYFPGKEAIIQTYYEAIQTEQERICGELFTHEKKLKARVKAAFDSKFELAKEDRRLLGVVFRYAGEPENPISCLGKGTEEIRRRSIAVFRDALAVEKLPEDLARLLPVALWAMQMGLLVMFLYDDSKGQRRTRKLSDGALEMALKLLALAKLPLLRPIRSSLLRLLMEAELLPE
ncbi:MAG TPA: TetR/AcrR family transcriptional regulator [Edaphobacter sp.]|nr:TetR/AcrR family transcriptional regulator [Edaphobacter sp.]